MVAFMVDVHDPSPGWQGRGSLKGSILNIPTLFFYAMLLIVKLRRRKTAVKDEGKKGRTFSTFGPLNKLLKILSR